MTQLPSDKFNIAWFKLAEFVVRKEKERALYIYRLLVHSLTDDAFISQLEGDLLLSFNDDKAIDCYLKAAHSYERQGRLVEAIAVYDLLIMLLPNNSDWYLKLAQWHEELGNNNKATHYRLQGQQYTPSYRVSLDSPGVATESITS